MDSREIAEFVTFLMTQTSTSDQFLAGIFSAEPHRMGWVTLGFSLVFGAGFAAQLGTKVALVEKHRIGGDCTWTGCMPSKALLKAAKVAHEIRTVDADKPDEMRRFHRWFCSTATPSTTSRIGI